MLHNCQLSCQISKLIPLVIGFYLAFYMAREVIKTFHLSWFYRFLGLIDAKGGFTTLLMRLFLSTLP
jgi:hypothetical protein